MNDTVLVFINYFAGRGHRTIEVGLQREGRYQAMVSKILAEEGVPQELIHLAQAESGFLPRAVSRAAATGMWQFVKFRGNEYGLAQTPYSDERLDPEKATRAAARHLHDLYNEFGDWYLAIAAYNCGPGNIEKAVERTGYADFWALRDRGALPKETTNYVPIILAMTIMSKNAAAYGLDQIVPDAAIEYDTIVTQSPTNGCRFPRRPDGHLGWGVDADESGSVAQYGCRGVSRSAYRRARASRSAPRSI